MDGCFDARMGTTDHHYSCATCRLGRRDDPGHLGRMRSHTPLASPLFIAEIRRWLRVVCLNCGYPVVNLEKFAGVRPPTQRLNDASLVSTDGVRCPVCGVIHPKIVPADDDYFSFNAEGPSAVPGVKGKPYVLYPETIRAAFERVTDATVVALGRPLTSHPRQLILKTIVIPPNTIRPGVRMGYGPAGAASYHDLTNMVQYIMKRNLHLPVAPPPQITKEMDRLIRNAQQLYYDLVLGAAATNPAQGSSGRRGLVVGSRGVRSIVRAFARKEGRIRKNLLGKRVWNISRSTISGNPLLRVDEVGYPVAFARTVSIRERVQEYNRDRLMTFFLNGRRQYPGCSRVIKRATGVVHRVEGLRRDFLLEVGDIVERDIVTGDLAYFNRQPSLERSSIGVHRIVVLEDPGIHTFQMNVVACSYYNADFDGDQMNLWVPGEVMSRVEAEHISGVANWFISTKSSGPVNGQVQDSNIGCFLLTRTGAVMSKFHAMRLFAGARVGFPDFSEEGPDARITGRDVVSRLFAQTPINYDAAPSWYNEGFAPFVDYLPSEIQTVMKRGALLGGVLDKKSVGEGARGGLFHLIAREYGPGRALEMIFALQQIAIDFVGNRGFTVGTADMVISPAALDEVQRITAGLLRDSEGITERLLRGELTPPIGMTTHEYYERLQSEALKVPDDLLRPVLTSIRPDDNGLFQMIATGSKGNTPNLLHVTALIGQVEINTRRIPEQFAFRRTNVYFPRFATSPAAFGFVANGYVSGMTGPEYVFSDMNGRFDLINKALSTASTGYQNRKAVMALQSDIIDNFRRVAKDTRVVQLLYGEDGLDARYVEFVPFRSVFLDDAALSGTFRLDLAAAGVAGAGPGAQEVFDAAFARVRADRDWYRRVFLRYEDSDFSNVVSNRRQMPVNVARLLRDARIAAEDAPPPAPDAEELVGMQGQVDELCRRLPYALINEIQERRGTPVPAHLRAAVGLLSMLVRLELGGPALLGLAPPGLGFILAEVRLRFAGALADYGTAAGILAAQAVSEPLTQYMLDSHHRSVGGGTNKAGIVRPAEIFGAKPVEAEQSSEMMLRVLPELEGDRAEVLQIANQIELMTFHRFVVRWALLLEPVDSSLLRAPAPGALLFPPFRGDRAWIDEFLRNHPLLTPPADLTNWCARFELDKGTMILKSMSLEAIVERLRARHPNAFVVHTPENVPLVVIRVYFRGGQFRRGAALTSEKVEELIRGPLLGTTIRGVRGIHLAEVVEAKRHRWGSDGSFALRKVWAIHTTGTNLYGVLLHKKIDPLRAVSSSIGDTAKVFGVAAARASIVREVRRAIGAKAPNVRHLLIYADEMTRTGRVTSLEKGGITLREKDNVLLRMAMSFPTQVLTSAAVENLGGRLHGVSPYLLLGRAPKLGTTWNSFAMDEEFVRSNTKTVDDVLEGLADLGSA